MSYGDAIIEAVKELLKRNPDEPVLPKALVEKMLETNGRLARESGQNSERTELVCRLLASDMPADEISLILKLRVQEIQSIEECNEKTIADYAKKLKARRKSRERAAR